MTNVVSINTARRQRRTYGQTDSHKLYQEVKDILTDTTTSEDDLGEQSRLLHDLDALSSDMLVRKLKLAHRRQADMRAWTAEEEAIAAEMEAAVYMAYAHGVPEEAIYDLNDESLSSALQSAMTKVATA